MLLVTAAWMCILFLRYSGLNSIARLMNYRDGLMALHPPQGPPNMSIASGGFEARIETDTLNIPHIFGRDAGSVAFATGYVHAKNRYFQMELAAYTVMGRLAEMLGTPAIGSDKQWRRFDLEEKAKAKLDSLGRTDPDLYAYLEAYGSGVNAWLSGERLNERDPLYLVWNCSPRPWKAYYAFLIQWYMSSDLAFYDDYVDRQEILDKLPAGVREAIYPSEPASQATIIPAKPVAKGLPASRDLVKLFRKEDINTYPAQEVNRSLGSNNWTIGRAHTTTGCSFLANDLHLFLSAPDIFFELHLSCPAFHVYGFSIPGVPLVVTGHNARIAWGITNGGWDVTEQYLLRIDPKDKNEYWLDGRWQRMTEKHYSIRVKDGKPEDLPVKNTCFGPLVQKGAVSYGLRWYPAMSCDAVGAFWKLMQARDWSDFRSALRDYDYPAQNFAYADVDGHIGMICAGRMPVKPAGYSGGLLDGTRSVHARFLDFDSLPQCFDPPQGYLFSANQEPEYGTHYYSSRWFDDLFRPERIAQLLSRSEPFSREDMQSMQLDVQDLSISKLKKLLDKYFRGEKMPANWVSMRDWDGSLHPGSEQAVFYKCYRRAVRMAGSKLARSLGVRSAPDYDQFLDLLYTRDSLVAAGIHLYCKDYIGDIVRKADSIFAIMSDRQKVDAYAFDIPQMTFIPGLERWITDLGGSDNTIDVNYGAHPVIRSLIEINGDGIQSWMINATGQTGRLNDADYFQQLEAWKKNRMHKTQFFDDWREIKAVKQVVRIDP